MNLIRGGQSPCQPFFGVFRRRRARPTGGPAGHRTQSGRTRHSVIQSAGASAPGSHAATRPTTAAPWISAYTGQSKSRSSVGCASPLGSSKSMLCRATSRTIRRRTAASSAENGKPQTGNRRRGTGYRIVSATPLLGVVRLRLAVRFDVPRMRHSASTSGRTSGNA